MSATLAPSTSPLPVPSRKPELVEVTTPVQTSADVAAAELRRWLVGLGTPFVLGAVFFALSIGTSAHSLIGVSLVLGPVLFLLMAVYLCLTSDSNGEAPVGAGGDVIPLR
jgi:hypothetical protein